MTVSERQFEAFLRANDIHFERVSEITMRPPGSVAPNERPDYLVRIGEHKIYFEVKELSEDADFEKPIRGGMTASSRTVGDHIRAKIRAARKQIQYGAALGFPSVLLIYNNIDPLHMFGTEDMDFVHAMYGEHTVRISGNPPKIVDSFFGKNARLQSELNNSFSAIGRLAPVSGKMTVALFENVYATHKLPFELLPPCFAVRRVELISG